MTRPTPAAIAFARSTLPVKRVASSGKTAPGFAALLHNASLKQAAPAPPIYHSAMIAAGAPGSIARSQIIANAEKLLNVPYVWGGVNATGLDCSAFVSKAWGVSRQTTDTLASVSHPRFAMFTPDRLFSHSCPGIHAWESSTGSSVRDRPANFAHETPRPRPVRFMAHRIGRRRPGLASFLPW